MSINSVSAQSVNNVSAPITSRKPVLDKIIQDNKNEVAKNNKETSFFVKFMTYPSFALPLLPALIGETSFLIKLLKTRKNLEKHVEVIEKSNHNRNLLILLASGIPLTLAVNYLNNKHKEKHINNAQNQVDTFNKENSANIKFVPKGINSSYLMGGCDPLSAQLLGNDKLNEDSILANTHQKHFINHELVHAKQYALMGCSEGGIEKLNYIALKKITKTFDEAGKKEVYDAYQEIKNGTDEHYKNETIDRFGYKMNLVDYTTALYKIMYEKGTTEKDIPMIINRKYYENIKEKKGKLSPEEEKKAQEYLKAYEEYPDKIGFMSILNPKSDYKQNLLEKEAYKMNPWYTR